MATRWGDRDARRRDILRAGRELLAREGYSALQMRDVAKGAGISPGTVYTYYPTKEALFVALYADSVDTFADALAAALTSCGDLEELFVAVWSEYVAIHQIYGRDLHVVEVMAGPARKDPAIGGRLVAATSRALGLLREGVEKYVPSGVDSEKAVALLWATMNGLSEQFMSSRRLMHNSTSEELVRFAARTMMAGLPHAASGT